MSLNLRKSPTLELAASIEDARRAGQIVYSLSTPTFEDRGIVVSENTDPKTTLSPAAGLHELREQTRTLLFSKWALPHHDCIITGGAKAAIYSILRVALSPGDSVLIVSPHWPTYEDLAELAHLKTSFLETRCGDGFALDTQRLQAVLRQSGAKAIICSNPGNPTGKILSPKEIASLRIAAAEFGAILLIDESFSNIVFDTEKWQSSVCDADDNIFVVNSFSKNFHLQGLRLGTSLVPRKWSPQVIAAHQTILSAAPTPSQNMALKAIETTASKIESYVEQRSLMLDFIASQGWPHVSTEGSFYAFPHIEDIEAFSRQLGAHGILLLAGETFGAPYRKHTRICFGKPLQEVHALVDIMREAVGTRKGEVA